MIRLCCLCLVPMVGPALAETGYHCRFDTFCNMGGCDQAETEVEFARRGEANGIWVFRDEDTEGTEGLALTSPESGTQVFVVQTPDQETTLFTLYPDGRGLVSTHGADRVTDARTGYGFCEVTG